MSTLFLVMLLAIQIMCFVDVCNVWDGRAFLQGIVCSKINHEL